MSLKNSPVARTLSSDRTLSSTGRTAGAILFDRHISGTDADIFASNEGCFFILFAGSQRLKSPLAEEKVKRGGRLGDGHNDLKFSL